MLATRRIRGEKERSCSKKIIDREKAPIDCSSRRGSAWLYGYQGDLVAMRDGFSGEGNTNGATLSSGGHIGIGGKHMGGLSTVVHWGVYHSVLTPHICHFLYANNILKYVLS